MFLRYLGPTISQRDSTVDNQFLIRAVLVYTEIALALELQRVARFCIFQAWFDEGFQHFQRVGVEIFLEAVAVRIFDGKQAVIQADFGGEGMFAPKPSESWL